MDAHFDRLLQEGAAQPAAGQARFQPSRTFTGARPGYYFGLTERGVGYHFDERQPQPAAGSGGGGTAGGAPGKRKRVVTADDDGDGDDDDDDAGSDGEAEPLTEAAIAAHVDSAEHLDIDELDATSLKQMLLAFERTINRNQSLRMKYPDDPVKFVDSECDLDDQLRALHVVAAAPDLYAVLCKHGAVESVLGLLAHDNTDVSISAVDLLHDLLDADTLADCEDDARPLVNAVVELHGLELLVQNMSRLDEAAGDGDAEAVHKTLTIFEALAEFDGALAGAAATKARLFEWLLHRVRAKAFHPNKLHAAEILSVVLQADEANPKRLSALSDTDGVDALLEAVAVYRKRLPESPDEEECIENLFNCLAVAVTVPASQKRYLDGEGNELMLRCLRERGVAAPCAVRALDFALQRSPDNCDRLVSIGGLKAVLPVFMGRPATSNAKAARVAELRAGASGKRRKRKRKAPQQSADELRAGLEHAVSIVASMCLHLPRQTAAAGGSDGLPRLVAKFVEADAAKTERAVDLYIEYWDRVRNFDTSLASGGGGGGEDDEQEGDERYVQLLDGGLHTLRLLAAILGVLVCRSAACRAAAARKLGLLQRDVAEIAAILADWADDEDDHKAEKAQLGEIVAGIQQG